MTKKKRDSFARLLPEPRRRIVQLLRRQPRTAIELAADLHRTDNAVRIQLSKLETDGLVHRVGKRSSYRKPEYLYELTPEAQRLFPKAYGPLVHQLLVLLGERMKEEELVDALDAVALRLATGFPPPSPGTSADERAASAVEVVEALGGAAGVEPSNGGFVVRGWNCPFAEVSPWHPEMCVMIAKLLTETTGLNLQEHCDRSPDAPQCAFYTS